MEYSPPLNATDPNQNYVDANPAMGVEGSIVHHGTVEPPQREIVNAIKAAGLTPSGADLTQLGQAIKALAVQHGMREATETIVGGAMLATLAEAQAGVDDTKIMTPAKVRSAILNYNPATTMAMVDLSAQVNGVTNTFSLPADGEYTKPFFLFYDNTYLIEGSNFTLNRDIHTITLSLSFILPVGTRLSAYYHKKGSDGSGDTGDGLDALWEYVENAGAQANAAKEAADSANALLGVQQQAFSTHTADSAAHGIAGHIAGLQSYVDAEDQALRSYVDTADQNLSVQANAAMQAAENAKTLIDAQQEAFQGHAADTTAHGASATPIAGRIAKYTDDGTLRALAPVDGADVATKDYADSQISTAKAYTDTGDQALSDSIAQLQSYVDTAAAQIMGTVETNAGNIIALDARVTKNTEDIAQLSSSPGGGGGGEVSSVTYESKIYEIAATGIKVIPVTGINTNQTFVEVLKFTPRTGSSAVVPDTLNNANQSAFDTVGAIKFTINECTIDNQVMTSSEDLGDGVQGIKLSALNVYSDWRL